MVENKGGAAKGKFPLLSVLDHFRCREGDCDKVRAPFIGGLIVCLCRKQVASIAIENTIKQKYMEKAENLNFNSIIRKTHKYVPAFKSLGTFKAKHDTILVPILAD